MITKLSANAYKGFRHFEIAPRNMNLLIGANGTGKTNFSDFIEFISLFARYGLKEAFDRQGGFSEVRTKRHAQGKPLTFECAIEIGADLDRGIENISYSFTLSQTNAISVKKENLKAILHRSYFTGSSENRIRPNSKKNGDSFVLEFSREKNKILKWIDTGSMFREPQSIFDDNENLILNAYGKLGLFRIVTDYLGSMRAYNIDVALAKEFSDSNEAELERAGGNMIPFLKRVMENEEMRNKILSNLQNAVPYIGSIVHERVMTLNTLKFTELDSELEFTAPQMSDGTIRLLGYLAILLQDNPPPVIVIEEPENALHQYATDILINIARSKSKNEKFPIQIFFTSHSSFVLDNILSIESQRETNVECFITKRKNGASAIEPEPQKTKKAILKNIGRPSDFLRDGSFGDAPNQIKIDFNEEEINENVEAS